MYARARACVYMFIKLHVTTQPGLIILPIDDHWYMCVCIDNDQTVYLDVESPTSSLTVVIGQMRNDSQIYWFTVRENHVEEANGVGSFADCRKN